MKQVGIDVGGTFTDLWAVSEGNLITMKVPSTPDDPSRAVSDALAAGGIDPAGIETFSHGTTIATNAFIQRNGAELGLLATRGFRDVVELGRRERPNTYGMYGHSRPLVPRDRRFEVPERTSHLGEVLEPLDEEAVVEAGRRLVETGVECVVVAFLHSYANPGHELRARELLMELDPEWKVVVSSDAMREFQEFARTSTACVQAYLSPLVDGYAKRLSSGLREAGFDREISIMQSNGGVVAIDKIESRANRLIRSGPAAGVIGAIEVGRAAGVDTLLTADMGGTSFDVAIVVGGDYHVSEETDLDFRIPLRLPTVDVASVGAGGGSIAWIDGTGLLQVGPKSAGAVPGPACYGLGGTQPTVTDANLALGRISGESRIGEGRTLDVEAARTALETVADPLGLTVEGLAEGILEIVNNNMANLIRQMTVERGLDPRDFVYLAYGGAGPLHADGIARLLGMEAVLVPPNPGVLCGMGSLLADVRHDAVQTVDRNLDPELAGEIREICQRHERWGMDELREEGVPVASAGVEHFADLCYEGQLHTLMVGFDPASDDPTGDLVASFHAAHRAEFGTELERPVRMVNLRTSARGRRPEVDWRAAGLGDAEAAGGPRETRMYIGGEWRDALIHDRASLAEGDRLEGPCVVEQTDCTTVLEPGSTAEVDALGNLRMEVSR